MDDDLEGIRTSIEEMQAASAAAAHRLRQEGREREAELYERDLVTLALVLALFPAD